MSKQTTLENFLSGKPLNRRMSRLMKGEEDEETVNVEAESALRKSFADGTPITKQDREHLRRMQTSAGWGVLLKLLDTKLVNQENSARQNSLDQPLKRKDEIATQWADFAADQRARNTIIAMVESEIRELENETLGYKGRKRKSAD